MPPLFQGSPPLPAVDMKIKPANSQYSIPRFPEAIDAKRGRKKGFGLSTETLGT
jgi:hypothetical protein